MAVESDTAARESLSRELNKRYGEDFEIQMFADPVRALDALGKHQASGEWKGQPVYVVRGGNSAGQTAVYLARYARQVTMLARGECLASGMSEYLFTEIENSENVGVRLQPEVMGGGGEYRLEELVLRNRQTGQKETVEAAALFVLIGAGDAR